MPGIRDNAALNIGADFAHDFGLLRSERLLSAQRQNRQGQFGFGRERFVVGCVLRKGGELIERGMHRAGPRVNFGVVLARRLVDEITDRLIG